MNVWRNAAIGLGLLTSPSATALAAPDAPSPSAPDKQAERKIREVIARWYEALAKKEGGRPYLLTAPGFIDASPYYRHLNNGSRALGPRIYTSLAAKALKFDYDVESIRADSSFAKVRVWERGYFYAWAAEKTYETAMSTTFLLERQTDGRWLIIAHESSSEGIPPNKVTDPLPDLRALWESTEGKKKAAGGE